MSRLRVSSALFLLVLSAIPAAAQEAAPAPKELPVATNALPPFTAISARGFVHSTERGFKFPDGTVQTTAATVTGGVPSVNGIAGAVTIAGAGTNTVTTSGSTITITGKPAYAKTIIVSPRATQTASGAALIAALEAITTASSTNRFLLKLEPGTYEIGDTQLVMRDFVDIEGSGSNATTILSTRGHDMAGYPATAIVAGNFTELRDINLHNVSAGNNGANVIAMSNQSFSLRNVTMTSHCGGEAVGLLGFGSVISLFNTSITAGMGVDGYGMLFNNPGIVTIRNSQIVARDVTGEAIGLVTYDPGMKLTIENSTFESVGGTVSWGVAIGGGTASITGSGVTVGTTTARTALSVSGSATNVTVHHSRFIAGNVWSGTPRAVSRSGTSTLKIYSSLVDSLSTGSPTCVMSYKEDGPNDNGSRICL